MSIPVLYYHRVNRADGRMAVGPEQFEQQMETLARKGWHAIGVAQLQSFLQTGRIDQPRPFLITFDDGYFDNWYYAFPALARTGMKAVIFLVSDWVREAGGPRPNRLQSPDEPPTRVLDKAIKAATRGDFADFLSAAEVREMACSGLIEFGSHGSGHRPCFAGRRIREFLVSTSVHWTKTVLADGDPRPGTPIYEWASALTVPVFHPDPTLREQAVAEVGRRLEAAGAVKPGRKEQGRSVRQWAETMAGNAPAGEFEPLAAARARIGAELLASRQKIEALTGAPCPALCWPWGQHSQLGVDAARSAGLELAFTTRTGAVCAGDDPFRLDRLRVSAKTSGRQLDLMMSALARPALARLARRFSPGGSTDHFIGGRGCA